MVRNPCMWHAPMNKMAGTPLGEMADQTVVGSVHNLDHRAFSFGASCGGSLKASDSSALVSLTAIINMSRAGNHEELLSGMTNNMREAAMDALVLLWLKNLNVDESPIVQSVSIQDTPGSYIAAAGGSRPKPSAVGGSKLDPSISKAKFRLLFLENLCEDVYVSIPRKVVETDVLKESFTIGVHLIEDMRFTIKIVSIPITVVTPVVPAPIVEMTNDGFQPVGKKKKGKSKSINGGQIGDHLVKQNVSYKPKATTINQYVLPLSNVGENIPSWCIVNENNSGCWELKVYILSTAKPTVSTAQVVSTAR
ncbi:hypothetical protein Tco_0045270, partial [Tanacetum coccineum]